MKKVIRTIKRIFVAGVLVGGVCSTLDIIYQVSHGSFLISGALSILILFAVNAFANAIVSILFVGVAVLIVSAIRSTRNKTFKSPRLGQWGSIIGAILAILISFLAFVVANLDFLNDSEITKTVVVNAVIFVLGGGLIAILIFAGKRIASLFTNRDIAVASYILAVAAIGVIASSYFITGKKITLPISHEISGPNVIVITIDALRRDHLSCYNSNNVATPNIDEIAERGYRFDNFYSNNPSTIPSMMTMNSGHYPSVHNADLLTSAPPDMINIAQVMSSHGYRTEAYTGNNILYEEYGFSKGFDVYTEYGDITSLKLIENTTIYRVYSKMLVVLSEYTGSGDDTTRWCTDNLVSAVKQNHTKEEPYFLWVHYLDPDVPLTPPGEYIEGDENFKDEALKFGALRSSNEIELTREDAKYTSKLYDAEVAYVDDCFSEILAAFDEYDVWEDTIIILTADHGKEHFEHNHYGHGRTHYSEVLAIPFIIYLPDMPGGEAVENQASLIDAANTILDCVGGDKLETSPGKSMLPQIEGNAEYENFVFADGTSIDLSAKSVRDGSYCLIRTGFTFYEDAAGYELYDIETDEFEQNNIYEIMDNDAKRLADELDNWEVRLEETSLIMESGNIINIDEEKVSMLRDFDYVK